MKSLKTILLFTCLFSFGLLISSCDNKGKKAGTEQSADTNKGNEYTSVYVCPMHCKDSGSDKAGSCPVCGMDYVINKDHKADGHQHEEDHSGHNHEEDHSGHNH